MVGSRAQAKRAVNMRSLGPDGFPILCMLRPHSQSDHNGKWPYIRRIFIALNAIETTDEMTRFIIH